MCNLCPYKNHCCRSKYPKVLLQESCEILQFKSGHPVGPTMFKWQQLSIFIDLARDRSHRQKNKLDLFSSWITLVKLHTTLKILDQITPRQTKSLVKVMVKAHV